MASPVSDFYESKSNHQYTDTDVHVANRVETVTHSAAVGALSAMTVEPSDEVSSSQEVLALFKQNLLLARAMEPEVLKNVDEDHPKVQFESHQNEMELLLNGTYKNVSCTLLVNGFSVNTYKPYGFLMSGKSAEILHAATHDISSVNNPDGSLNAPDDQNMSLADLAKYVQNTPDRYSMNEVNANFILKDLKGLFVNKADSLVGAAEAFVIQKMIKNRYGIELPVFVYDGERGNLEPCQLTSGEIIKLLMAVRGPLSGGKMGIIKAQLIAPYFGYTVSDRGRIQQNDLI